MKPLWIDTPAQLAEACAQWQTREWISVDTEFVRINTYHAHLCLVQIGDGELNACIDPLAIEDLAPMWALMANPDILKVFHASGQDFELVVEHTGRTPAPVFDTQIAATLIGLGDQLGYAGLVEKRLGLPVDKVCRAPTGRVARSRNPKLTTPPTTCATSVRCSRHCAKTSSRAGGLPGWRKIACASPSQRAIRCCRRMPGRASRA